MIDLHELAKTGAEANLINSGEVMPMFFGQLADGTIYATPAGPYSSQSEKEYAFHTRLAALRGRGAERFTLVVETYCSTYQGTEGMDVDDVLASAPRPSEDPNAKEAVLVQTSGVGTSLLVFGRDDHGEIVVEGWEEMPGQSEGWVPQAMEELLSMEITEGGRNTAALMEKILGLEVFRLRVTTEEEE